MVKSHLYLIGYRGAGKSSVGKSLANQLGWDCIDSDEIIEQQAGKSIREIFATESEQGFRDREQRTVESIAAIKQAAVVSLGGGAILREANQRAIRQSGRIVWLFAKPETLYARIVADESTAQRRPNLSASGGFAEVIEILAAREPIYRQLADYTVETDGLTTDKICHDVLRWLATQHPS